MDGLIISIAILAVLAGPILAIIALVSARRIEGELGNYSLRQLVARITSLEQRLAASERAASEATKAPSTPTAVAPEVKVPSPAPPPLPGPPATIRIDASQLAGSTSSAPGEPGRVLSPLRHWEKAPSVDLESRIAGNWFNRIGIVAILFAVSYGLKWAFDNNWIGPSGRVAIGVLLGAVMLPWSQWLLGKGYTYFSEGIAALGEATLFLSVWAGCQYYTLYSRDVGFAAMIVISAVMAAVAIGRNSQRIAVLSLLGGLLTPILASSGKDQQIVLFTYLILLGAGALAVESKKDWKSLAPIAFVGTQIYFWGWYSEFFHRASPLERTVVFATLFFLLYAALPVFKALRARRLGELGVFIVLFNAFTYSVALFVLLWPEDKWPLTLLFVALAAGHAAIARLLPVPDQGQSEIAPLVYAGLALTFLTLAIPVRLEGKWITLSFSVEGAILVWTGFRTASNYLRQAGYLLLAISALRLLFLPPAGGAFLFNARFAGYLVMIASFAVALWSARTHSNGTTGTERAETGILAVAINVYALIALSLEFWDYFGKASFGMDAALAQHLSLSILWTGYASALLFFGLREKSALVRWQGLALFGLVVGKVFLYDLSFLDKGYRILSFFVLGAVLLGVSFSYTRKTARERGAS